ncbi:MAG: hypothetical protein LC118_18745 [Dehalococcoidia bacterium]|nr:hypothetical protein [Dehalococcoidia bacterium]
MPPLPAAVEVAAFRIAQEALTNVLRHAHASACELQIETRPRALVLSILDNGHGLDESSLPGVGLRSMRERAEELGGSLTLEPRDGGGTVVRAILPCILDEGPTTP